MYATAQRVRSTAGDEAIHVFVYAHDEHAIRGVDWVSPDAGFIAETHPGRLLLSARALAGQPLSVISYLDGAFHNSIAGTAADLLRRLMAAFPAVRSWPLSWTIEGIGCRFYATPPRRGAVERELKALQDALQAVLGDVEPREIDLSSKPSSTATPFMIERRHTQRGYEFTVERNSRAVLESAGVTPPYTTVSVSVEQYKLFETVTGREIEPEIVGAITKLSIEQLDSLGGAQVVDAEDETPLWQTPRLADSAS